MKIEPLGVAAFRDYLNIEPDLFRRRLEETSVSVVSLGGIPIDPLLSVLESLHVRIAEAGTFRVVLTDDYLRNGLESYNRTPGDTVSHGWSRSPWGASFGSGRSFTPHGRVVGGASSNG